MKCIALTHSELQHFVLFACINRFIKACNRPSYNINVGPPRPSTKILSPLSKFNYSITHRLRIVYIISITITPPHTHTRTSPLFDFCVTCVLLQLMTRLVLAMVTGTVQSVIPVYETQCHCGIPRSSKLIRIFFS
jgi:hypothetical protein